MRAIEWGRSNISKAFIYILDSITCGRTKKKRTTEEDGEEEKRKLRTRNRDRKRNGWRIRYTALRPLVYLIIVLKSAFYSSHSDKIFIHELKTDIHTYSRVGNIKSISVCSCPQFNKSARNYVTVCWLDSFFYFTSISHSLWWWWWWWTYRQTRPNGWVNRND